jgi:hypothetical protein
MDNYVQSPYIDVLLDNLQYQGTSNDCSPYSTATVINALTDENLVGDELPKYFSKISWRAIFPLPRGIPGFITFPWGMVDIFRDFDLNCSWRIRTPISYLKPTLETRKILMPMIGELRPKPWVHVMPLVAWHPEHGWGFANTQYTQKNINYRSDVDFREKWNNYVRILIEIKKPD